MSNDLNKCMFIGRLGADPESRYMPSGKAVCNFRIACGSQWKDKDGEKQERTEWVSVSAFDKLAEICGEYLKKGAQVFIEGRMQTRKWQDKEGNDRYTTEIIAERMQMLGSRQDRSEKAAGPSVEEQSAAPFDDDIPF